MGAFMSQLFAGCALQPKGTMPGMCMCVFVVGGGGVVGSRTRWSSMLGKGMASDTDNLRGALTHFH